MSLYEDLLGRGLIHQVTDPKIQEYLDHRKMTAYLGIDPTSDSLHVGTLLGLMTLRRMQKAGHKIIALVGGATGCIGDPSGKSQERQLLSAEQIEKNVTGMSRVISRFIEFDSPDKAGAGAILLNNFDWFKSVSILDFLRDTGKHFTVNYMTAKDSVQSRLQDREHGISFTEFSYMLLQSYDFYYLYANHGCSLQVGGADQWGNITAGIEFIRKKTAQEKKPAEQVFGLTWPLVTKSDGSKFGKSESGNIWLSAEKTSVYDFYQFFLRTQDKDVVLLLKYFTTISLSEIEVLEKSVEHSPEKREAQIALAREMTILVHGEQEYAKVQSAASSLFSTDLTEITLEEIQQLIRNAPSTQKPKSTLSEGLSLIELLVETQLVGSKGQARNDIVGGGIYVNNIRIEDVHCKLREDKLILNQYIILRKGKKNYHTVVFT